MIASDRLFGTSISRWLAMLAAALLALTLLPATSAFGQEDVDDPQDACPEDPPPAPYTDRGEIPEVHVRNVDCVTHRNIALGFADNTYRPALPVPRDQMASFVHRTLVEAGFDPPDGGRPPPPEFDDIVGNTHEAAINSLARAGIVEGGPEELPPTSYGPRRLVRRDQMASYLMRAAEWACEMDFGEGDQRFPDVPPGNVHFRNVNGAHEWSIALGYADGTYGPRDSTRRDQMASFLARLLVFLETCGEPTPPETPEPTPEPPIETFTNAPELIAAEHVRTTTAGHVDVRYIFDVDIEAVHSSHISDEGFHLHGFDGYNVFADSVILDPGRNDAVVARFENLDEDDSFETITVAAVDADQVGTEADNGEPDGLTNPEGAVALQAPVLNPGQQWRDPGLLAVENVRRAFSGAHGTHVRAEFIWDRDALDNMNSESFFLILNQGETIAFNDSTGAVVAGDGTDTHTVVIDRLCEDAFNGWDCTDITTEAAADFVVEQARRGWAASCAVDGDVSGFCNMPQTVDIAQGGMTAGPDITNVVLRPDVGGSDLVDVFFDEDIDDCDDFGLRLEYWRGDFFTNDSDGCTIGTGANTNRVTYEFDEGEVDTDFLAFAHLRGGRVDGDDSGFTNMPHTWRFEYPFGLGDTAAPVLTDVVIDEDDLTVTYAFDVDVNDDGFWWFTFSVYDMDGERTILVDCDIDAGEDNEVVCEATGLGEEAAVQTAVLGGVHSDTVRVDDRPEGTPTRPRNHADSEPVTTA